MVKSNTAPAPKGGETNSGSDKSDRAIFIIAALDMSWRLAIVILVPIIGGFELDKHLGTKPALTIVGFLVAMAGLFFILKRTMTLANEKFKMRTPR
jgi:F0F1-type ATP synthase assembly protein I